MEKPAVEIKMESVRSTWIHSMGYSTEYRILVTDMGGTCYAYRDVDPEKMQKLKQAADIIEKLETLKREYSVDESDYKKIKDAHLGKSGANPIDSLQLKNPSANEIKEKITSGISWFLTVINMNMIKHGLMGSAFHGLGLWTAEAGKYLKLSGSEDSVISDEVSAWVSSDGYKRSEP
jgi:hypothetical protein